MLAFPPGNRPDFLLLNFNYESDMINIIILVSYKKFLIEAKITFYFHRKRLQEELQEVANCFKNCIIK